MTKEPTPKLTIDELDAMYEDMACEIYDHIKSGNVSNASICRYIGIILGKEGNTNFFILDELKRLITNYTEECEPVDLVPLYYLIMGKTKKGKETIAKLGGIGKIKSSVAKMKFKAVLSELNTAQRCIKEQLAKCEETIKRVKGM